MTTQREFRRPRSWQEMREQEIRWLVERTCEGLETWNARRLAGADDVDDFVDGWLRRSYEFNS